MIWLLWPYTSCRIWTEALLVCSICMIKFHHWMVLSYYSKIFHYLRIVIHSRLLGKEVHVPHNLLHTGHRISGSLSYITGSGERQIERARQEQDAVCPIAFLSSLNLGWLATDMCFCNSQRCSEISCDKSVIKCKPCKFLASVCLEFLPHCCLKLTFGRRRDSCKHFGQFCFTFIGCSDATFTLICLFYDATFTLIHLFYDASFALIHLFYNVSFTLIRLISLSSEHCCFIIVDILQMLLLQIFLPPSCCCMFHCCICKKKKKKG
jgi:hypothetical protein